MVESRPAGTRIVDALAGKRIFLTGVTGFLGQVILERLLLDFPETTITVLVRSQTSAQLATEETITIARGAHYPSIDLGANYWFKRPGVLSNVDWDFSVAEKDYQNAMKVFVPIALDKPVPFAKAVDQSFLKKAQAKSKS